jgi:hypothetical protein
MCRSGESIITVGEFNVLYGNVWVWVAGGAAK